MTWVGLCDRDGGVFAPQGLDAGPAAACVMDSHPDALLTCGTLMIEVPLPEVARPWPLFGFTHTYPWARQFILYAGVDGQIGVAQSAGDEVRSARVSLEASHIGDAVRISYAWDCARGFARLGVEIPGQPVPIYAHLKRPMPLRIGDLRGAIEGAAGRIMAPAVIYAALSSKMLPLGPWSSIAPGSYVATPDGPQPIGTLVPGSLVTTPEGPVPVLHVIRARLPARGSFAPVHLRAPYLGLREDVVLGPDQRLLIEGSVVEYMFSQEAVLVPARHFVDGTIARFSTAQPLADYVQLILPQHAALQVAGVWTDSLYLGRLRRSDADLAQTCLADAERAVVPEHALPRYTVLRRFDALVLAEMRVA